MSAKRMSLLATAAILGGVLAPTATSWAQPALGYGTKSIVDHNDLRWFEPVELDLDGQMPRRDAGFFFTADKLWWGTIHPKLEIGQEGLTVDSERIYRAPSNDTAFLALTQTQGFGFINDLDENLSYSGIKFVVANTQGTDSLTDDTVMDFDTTGILTVAGLKTAVEAFNADPVNIAANMVARVGGEPRPYQVRNGIRDALPDAGFSWGERYEFGYSDGDNGWMMTVLDGPESRAGGTYGAGEGHIYFSQSGTEIFGADPYFLSDLDDDDGDGIGDGDGEGDTVDIWAFGFGSVPVNFNLPTPDFLSGYRDYYDNSVGASGGVTAGPIMYVGNYGAAFDDLQTVNLGVNPSFNGVDVNGAVGAIGDYSLEASDPPTTDPNETALDQQISIMLADINSALTATSGLDDEDQLVLAPFFGNAQNAILALQTAQNLAAAGNGGMVPPNVLDAEITAVLQSLTALNVALSGVVLEVDDADGGDVVVNEAQRVADDIDGNGQAGTFQVLADIDGDGVIEAGEVVGIINNFGDLHTFNVFFDQVTIRNNTEIDGVELMRTHQVSTRHKLQQGRWDDLRLAYGVRFLNIEDDFYFEGIGSILGRTWVNTNAENQIIAPQLGLKWTRRDGPWNFVLEARGAVGYNVVDVDQEGIFGYEAIPGALNRSATARTTTSVDGFRYDEFSPIGELRAQLRYRVAEAVSLQAGYTAKYVGNIHRGGDSTKWNAPDFGVHDHTGDIFTNGLNIGIELRH
ncbi:hypothetical protein MalM25_30310 [Planctomycetes bacterium MalM25]|nr:hypothetical protein MalM25_30310 [Planctomycetes bacterium MalM25]